MKTPAWHRFVAEWGTLAAVVLTLAGLALVAYRILAKGV